MARQCLTENCRLRRVNGRPVSLGVSSIIGRKNFCPFFGPVATAVSIDIYPSFLFHLLSQVQGFVRPLEACQLSAKVREMAGLEFQGN